MWQKAYSACDPYDFDIYPSESHRLPSHSFMHLTVLRVSRQLYAEANQILWTTNTFSFRTGTSLRYFLMTRTFHQKRSIRRLRCRMDWRRPSDWRRPGDHEWGSALDVAVIKSLTGLRTLRLKIFYDIEERFWHAVKQHFVQTRSSYTEALWKLPTLSLTSAEVIVRTSPYSLRHDLWRKNDCDQCARNIQEMLLNPKRAEIYSQQQSELKKSGEVDQEIEQLILGYKFP